MNKLAINLTKSIELFLIKTPVRFLLKNIQAVLESLEKLYYKTTNMLANAVYFSLFLCHSKTLDHMTA